MPTGACARRVLARRVAPATRAACRSLQPPPRGSVNLIKYEILAIVISTLTLLAVALLISNGLLKSVRMKRLALFRALAS